MRTSIHAAAAAASAAIPPLWPLAATVAVNPFLGHAAEPLALTAARLARAGVRATPSPEHVAARFAAGTITDADVAAALAAAGRPGDAGQVRASVTRPAVPPVAIATIADLASEATGRDWTGVVAERFGHWAGAYLDAGQALWAAPVAAHPWAAWRTTATHDLTPEIMGLTGFATFIANCPDTADAAIERAVATLDVPAVALEAYFHRLLMSLGGWAQAARQRQWVAEQHGGSDDLLRACLAIRLVWEEALFRHCGKAIARGWADAVAAYAAPLEPTAAIGAAAIVQDAADRAAQRRLATALAAPVAAAPRPQPQVQAAFCIDVRSEVFRRALEAADPGIATIGFAGFFGLGVGHHRMASDVLEARLPVLLTPGVRTRAVAPAAVDTSARHAARAARAWDRFKLAAVSSFAFVEAAGPAYVVKLIRDALAIGHAAALEPSPQPEPPLPLDTRVATAEAVLRAMSLTRDFAPLVLLAGHGAAVVNNPHTSALHCGACGGYAGDVNARLLAALLNAVDVRDGLAVRGIAIPPTTRFVAGLHDTTSDTVKLFTSDTAPADAAPLDALQRTLDAAGVTARAERALRLPRGGDGRGLARRGRDWGEVRPEWGLAGCNAFIAAPRARTIGRDLGGRVFLHDYAWADDAGFGTLELILTAPVVVASWISLQYYGSVVAPDMFGAGNKLLHNVVGGIGVLEGNGGVLRSGLPWQSVSDGHDVVHDPVRLTVVIEAPREAISAVLAKHDGVRALFDNRWLHLFAMDERGGFSWRYVSGAWERETPSSSGKGS